ncbi:GGDEF domain-containing protein [Candidatus Oscillochloris fontis]|uniref:GGDEF domain-containing protein n=1 Tax=Candidatus Oscillochloris fontis TaxID=2496868 RepID=UPI00137611C7|nr:GGDEF domain-containing protein [Candidatus Oscillochloris fontis]
MIKLIEKIGIFYASLIITVLSILLSQMITHMIYIITQDSMSTSGKIASLLSPLIIAPFFSWWFMGMLLRIHALERKMRFLATYDVLTGVYNRNSFFIYAIDLLNLIQQEQHELTVLYIDIDNFKNINDVYGHDIGDSVLKNFGLYLRLNVRDSDLIGRIGGEEFVIALPKTSLLHGQMVAEDLRQGLEYKEMALSRSDSINITISIGISNSNHKNYRNIDQLIKMSDTALYEAKKSGRNRIVVSRE